jgi:hypothetical protein
MIGQAGYSVEYIITVSTRSYGSMVGGRGERWKGEVAVEGGVRGSAERLSHGIPIHDSTVALLRGLAEEVGAPTPERLP